MGKRKNLQKRESTEESYYHRLIREKVEDMEQRVARGVLDQESVTVNRVHTFVGSARTQIARSEVVAWFRRYRPQLIEQSKLADIADCIRMMNSGRYSSPDFTSEQIWSFIQGANSLEITKEEIESYLARKNSRRTDETDQEHT